MHSLSNRLNAVFFYGVFCILLLSAFNILTTIFTPGQPDINNFQVNKAFTLYNNQYTLVQHSRSYFDLDVDFTKVINWNNHITFMWISAEYQTGKTKTVTTKVTIYDQILPRQDNNYKIILKNQLFEYPLIDAYSSLSGKKVTFRLNWEHMPVIGPILKHSIELGSEFIPKEEVKPIQMIIRSEYNYENLERD